MKRFRSLHIILFVFAFGIVAASPRPPEIKITTQTIPQWQRDGEYFEGSIAVTTANPAGAAWHLEIDVHDENGKYLYPLIFPTTTSSIQDFHSSDDQLKAGSFENRQFVYYAVLEGTKISFRATGSTRIIHRKWTNENIVFLNEQKQALKIPLKYIAGATGARIQISRVAETSHNTLSLWDFTTMQISAQTMTDPGYFVIATNNSSNLIKIPPGVFHYSIDYLKNADVIDSDDGYFDLTKIGRFGNSHPGNDTLLVFVGGNANSIESDFQALTGNSSAQASANWSIVKNFNTKDINYNTWYIAQSNTNYIENNAYDVGIGIRRITGELPGIKHIYIVSHSLGGIQVKAMLANMGKKLGNDLPVHFSDYGIVPPVEKIIFLGTPHKGIPWGAVTRIVGNAAEQVNEGSAFFAALENRALEGNLQLLNITGNDPYNLLTAVDLYSRPSDGVVMVYSSENPVLLKKDGTKHEYPALVQLYVNYNVISEIFDLHTSLHETGILKNSKDCGTQSTLEKIVLFLRKDGTAVLNCSGEIGAGPASITITTGPATSISSSTANIAGSIPIGTANIIAERGIVYNTSPNPAGDNFKITSGTGSGLFTTTLTGLSANTIYYVRAYAVSGAGIIYGNEVNFTTSVADVMVAPPSKDPQCNERSTGDYCFQNNTNMNLEIIVTSSKSKVYSYTSPFTCTIQPGQQQCFFNVPAGPAGYQIKTPATVGVYKYNSSSPAASSFSAKGSLYVDTCRQNIFYINGNAASYATNDPQQAAGSVVIKAKDGNCAANNTGDFGFLNTTGLNLEITFRTSKSKIYSYTSPYTSTIQPGQQQYFYSLPAGPATYEIRTPATVTVVRYGEKSNPPETYLARGSVYIEPCLNSFFVIK